MSPKPYLPGRQLPPPDPSTRVEDNLVADSESLASAKRRRGGELIVAAGLGGILVSVCSAFVKLLDLPSLSEKSVAGFGATLVVVGAFKAHPAAEQPIAVGEAPEGPSIGIDLPSLTGQISGVLAQLRQEHGLAYRTRTWIEEILPTYGRPLTDPTLARDLLAAAALDAGGIRADLAGLAEAHSRDAIIVTGVALLEALDNTLAACESPARPAIRPSDPSSWPAAAWLTAPIGD